MAESDFSRSGIGGYGSSPSHRGPSVQKGLWPTRRPPGSRTWSMRACQVLRPRRVAQALALALLDILPSATQTASAPGISFLSRLDGWPARSPADASPTSSRTPAHGSGPMRFAIPSSSWTFTTYYSPPVSRRTQGADSAAEVLPHTPHPAQPNLGPLFAPRAARLRHTLACPNRTLAPAAR